MTTLTIKNGTVIMLDSVLDNSWVHCAGGKIESIGQDNPPDAEIVIDAQGGFVLPGFVDVHVHGAAGHDVMDASLDGLHSMGEFFAQHGVTSYLPTTLTGSNEATTAALETIRDAMHSAQEGARIAGAHLEGPYLHISQSGAQDKEYIRPVDREEFTRWLDLDVIRLVSVAPEQEDIGWLIEICAKRGVTVSAAHTTASYETAQAAIAQGLSHSTHTYNAMPKLHHRTPGALAALLLEPSVNYELIADNIHVHPAMVKLLLQTVSLERLVLVTDAMRATGLADGVYKKALGQYDVTVRDGQARLDDGTLAGSTLTMNGALVNLCATTGKTIAELWQASSHNAARAIGLGDTIGTLATGYDADLVILDCDDPEQVCVTISQGRVIYDKSN